MADIDEQKGKRCLIRRNQQNYYFFISATDIMFSAPGEGDIRNQDEYSAINAICRLISKLRHAGESWVEVLKQLDGANVTGNETWCAVIARVIRGAVA